MLELIFRAKDQVLEQAFRGNLVDAVLELCDGLVELYCQVVFYDFLLFLGEGRYVLDLDIIRSCYQHAEYVLQKCLAKVWGIV